MPKPKLNEQTMEMTKGTKKRSDAKGGGSVIYLNGSDASPNRPNSKKSGRRKNPYGEGTIYKCQSGRFKDKWMGQLIIVK